MKQLLLFSVLTMLIIGCKSQPNIEDAIIGKWEGSSTVNDTATPSTWEFFEDGTMIITTYTLLDTSFSLIGTYSFEDDDTITLQEDGSDAAPGRRDVRMPDENTLILTAPISGDQAVLKRVPEL